MTTDFTIPTGVFAEKVTYVRHYTNTLFSFRMTRPKSFRFRSGEFVMIGLPNAEKPIFRAYSIASPSWDEELEFYSIKVPDGPLTEHLQKIQIGHTILMRPKSTGTLILDALLPGKRLYMLATGTGIAPFVSLLRDPETYEKFESIILVHGCRHIDELQYGQQQIDALKTDELIGEFANQLLHYPTVTREEFRHTGRITDLMTSGRLFEDLGLPRPHPEEDRGMICGSMDMIKDTKEILKSFQLQEGANNKPGTFVVERAFVG